MARMVSLSLLVASLLAWSAAPAGVAATSRGHEDLNYHQLALPDTCVDLETSCVQDAFAGDCILHPYEVRSRCPLSCRVQRCNARDGKQYHISGQASAAGTYEYSKRMTRLGAVTKTHFRLAYTSISSGEGEGGPDLATALMLSCLGTSALVHTVEDTPAAAPSPEEPVVAAILHALSHGWNVIDVAQGSNVSRAEAAVGEALTAALAGSSFQAFPVNAYHEVADRQHPHPGDLTRDMVFVSTKAGWIEPAEAQRLIDRGAMSRGDAFHDLYDDVPGSGDAEACLHPACLIHGVRASLDRLLLKTVDVLYLDRIEAHLRAHGLQTTMGRLRVAFKALEGMRKEQQIVYYGLASWESFATHPKQTEYLSLEAVVALAEEVGGKEHGFRFIQVPLNPAMPEAWLEAWQPVGTGNLTLLEAAKKLKVQVFTTNPLHGGDLVKLLGMRGANVEHMEGLQGGGAKLLQWVRSTPGVLASLVEHAARGHVENNVRLAQVKPLNEEGHKAVYDKLLELSNS